MVLYTIASAVSIFYSGPAQKDIKSAAAERWAAGFEISVLFVVRK